MAFDVSTSDIEARWRSLTTDESDVAFARLEDAALRLRLLRPALDAFVNALPVNAARTDLEHAIRVALAEAVIRYLRNPDVLRSQTIGADGAVGIGFETDPDAIGGVYISEDDLAAIDAAVGAVDGTGVRRGVHSQVITSSWPWRTTATSLNTLPTP